MLKRIFFKSCYAKKGMIIMNKLSLMDTHCDTAYELFYRKENIVDNSCHISLNRARRYEHFTQFFAIWANKRLNDDQAYEDYIRISDNFIAEVKKSNNQINIVLSFKEMQQAHSEGKAAAFCAVEDARILGKKIERLEELKKRGVKYLTLMWGGTSCIGGSHNVRGGLTEFGKQVVHECFRNGIIPDISHSNTETADDVINIAYMYNKPFIATHSNSYSVYPHSRNLHDEHLSALIELGGTVGINLCPYHICDMSNNKLCGVEDIIPHIERYISLGAENNICLGCDLDGTSLPEGFSGVDDLYKIAECMANHGYTEEIINKVFYKNLYKFIEKNM